MLPTSSGEQTRRGFLAGLATAAALAAAEPCDWVLTADYAVTMDEQRRVLRDAAVAVRGDRIAAVGTRAEILARYTPRHRRDYGTALLAPGLINTHTHVPMSLFRGIADDLRLQDWLTKYIFPAEAKFVSPEFVRWGTRLGCLEMALSGTTTFTDMYYFEEVIAAETKAAGLRGVLGQTVIQFPVADAKTPADALKRAEPFFQQYNKDPLIIPAIAPHAFYTNSDETLKSARELANRYDKPLVTHLSETRQENDDTRKQRKGQSPTQVLESLGVLRGRTVCAHAVWCDEQDVAILERTNTGVAHCPSSNMKLASGVAPVLRLLARGVPTGLGTDGPAGSNNDFDMMEEMNLAANLQKVTSLDPQALPARQAVEMATIHGARALGLQSEIGSLQAGKRADIIAISLDSPRAHPFYNVYSQMVYALKGADVRDVFINGRQIVRDRQMLTLDQKTVLAKADQYQQQVQAAVAR